MSVTTSVSAMKADYPDQRFSTPLQTAIMSVIKSLFHKLRKANRIRRNFGMVAMLQHGMNVTGSRLLEFEALTLGWLSIDEMKTELDLPEDIEMRFLSAGEVEMFALDPQNDLTESHVEKAHAGTDHCFAALIDGRLASYGWYTLDGAYLIGNNGLLIRYPSNAAYMHSGFTHPDFRGRRLHGIGMGRALLALSEKGINALLSDVDWANHASLKSCNRLGYQMLGNVYSIGRGQGRIVFVPRTARSLGITIERLNDLPALAENGTRNTVALTTTT